MEKNKDNKINHDIKLNLFCCNNYGVPLQYFTKCCQFSGTKVHALNNISLQLWSCHSQMHPMIYICTKWCKKSIINVFGYRYTHTSLFTFVTRYNQNAPNCTHLWKHWQQICPHNIEKLLLSTNHTFFLQKNERFWANLEFCIIN